MTDEQTDGAPVENPEYTDTPLQEPVDETKAQDSKKPIREGAPVQGPHWHALIDMHKILPCEVLPVNSTVWKTVVDVVKDDNSDQLVLITDTNERLYERDVHTPVLVRTTADSADLLH